MNEQILKRAFYFFSPIVLLLIWYYKEIIKNPSVLFIIFVASILGFILYNYLYFFVEEFKKSKSKNKIGYGILIVLIVSVVYCPLFYIYYKVILSILTKMMSTY